ncbi:hypothetical protein BJV74DRAFT_829427 [Russula compacta]|nr:hypothetical protein BJV74DRAFT_829427 [Russula compacta]
MPYRMSKDFIATALGRVLAGTTRVEFVHKPYISWPYPRPDPHSLTGSPHPTGVPPFRVVVLDSSFNPPTLAISRLLLLSIRNADKPPRPGDASPVQPQLTFIQGIDTLERFLAPRYYGDGSVKAMHAALRRFFDIDGNDARVICARRAIDLVDPRGESALLEVAQEWVQADRIKIVDIDDELLTFSSSGVRAKVRATDSLWRQMVPSSIAEYIEEQGLYLEVT